MKKISSFASVAIVVLIIWLGLIYSPNISFKMFLQELWIGIIVSIIVSLFTFRNFKDIDFRYFHPRRIAYLVVFFFVFLEEMVKANLNMARIVLSPTLPIKPGIVEIETTLKQPVAKLFMGNAITLTPGTLTIECNEKKAYIHWVYVESKDPRKAGDIIKGRFEKVLEGVFK